MKEKNYISAFEVPQDYFDNFEARLFQRIKEEERFPNSSGFTVPEAYFDNMEQRMLKAVVADGRKTIPLFPKKYFGYAAAIAACLAIGVMLFTSEQSALSMDTIQLSMLDRYIEDGNLNLDLYDLTNYLDDNDLSGMNLESQQIPEGVLKIYLLENMDGSTLMDEGLDPFE